MLSDFLNGVRGMNVVNFQVEIKVLAPHSSLKVE